MVSLAITQKFKLPFQPKIHVVGFVIVVRIVLGHPFSVVGEGHLGSG